MKIRSDIWFLVIAGVLFGLFLLNIFMGKAALVFNIKPILAISDVGEFLILLGAVVFFVIEVLRRESRESDIKTKSADSAVEDS